jgi:hypothetical protein
MSDASAIQDFDRDSLHTLSLSIHPFKTAGLRHARLIKNSKLESVVEFFRGPRTGSGQVAIEDLWKEFDWPEDELHPDLLLLRKLGSLPSYDVYSLRILYREQGIPVTRVDYLKLSDHKVEQLTGYMRDFTHPLILQVYGRDDMSIRDFEDVIALFRHPNLEQAREKLKKMADILDIAVDDLPKFLEDCGDIFLSLSYYRQCLDQTGPVIRAFIESLGDIRSNHQLRDDQYLMKVCNQLEDVFGRLQKTLEQRFEHFDRLTRDMWNEISADRFRQIAALISGYHTTIGAILCALTVKMNAWAALFPTRQAGGPVSRAEFIMSDMRLGLETIRSIEAAAPRVQNLDGPSGS